MKRSKLSKNGFTLIELLVVISIVSFLSSVVLSNLRDARQKAQYAANAQLDANFNHALADSLVGQWLFDEGNTPTKDTSGNGNNGVAQGSPTWSSMTPFNKGLSLDETAGGRGFNMSNSSVLMPKKFTASAWIYATPSYSNNHARVLEKGGNGYCGGGGYGIEFDSNGGLGGDKTAYGVIWSGCASNTRVSPPDGSIALNKWYFVLFSFDGSTARFYINGNKQAEVSSLTMLSSGPAYNDLCIGMSCRLTDANDFLGYIDSVRIYNRDLDTAEIQQLYAEGLPSHQTLARK